MGCEETSSGASDLSTLLIFETFHRMDGWMDGWKERRNLRQQKKMATRSFGWSAAEENGDSIIWSSHFVWVENDKHNARRAAVSRWSKD